MHVAQVEKLAPIFAPVMCGRLQGDERELAFMRHLLLVRYCVRVRVIDGCGVACDSCHDVLSRSSSLAAARRTSQPGACVLSYHVHA
jgi:hypothetical protein